MGECIKLLQRKGQLILTGPPGTGKTRKAMRLSYFVLKNILPPKKFEVELAGWQGLMLQDGAPGAWEIVQFHPSYNYDDFVRGIRIRTNADGQPEYRTEDGPLLAMAKTARDNSRQKFVLIIDEINRANVAAVLGEMIYALEYRGKKVSLQYAGTDEKGADRRVALPENLYIIGTMNTADRSIGHLDYAVRRRFAFVPLKPRQEVLEADPEEAHALSIKAFEKVRSLFYPPEGQTPEQRSHLSADYNADDVQPGHSYFLAKTEEELQQRMKYEVGPLLREYVADGVLKQSAVEVIERIEAGNYH